MPLPKGRVPNDTLNYCVMEAGGSIEEFLEDGEKFKSIKLGFNTFTAKTNRELLTLICYKVSELPE